MENIPLNQDFYLQKTEIVAKRLLGKLFQIIHNGKIISAEITETEAYLPQDDPACHAAFKKTNRNAPMFELGGILYVYFIYGNYYCANVVTEAEGLGAAVLIRSAKPIDGIEFMMQNRRKSELRDLLTGPGKFAQAFGLDKSYNYRKLDSNEIRICEFNDYSNSEIITTTRIGINKGAELPLRFYVKNCDFISKKVR